MSMNIAQLTAQEILDSRGNPTVIASLTLSTGQVVTAAVPSGASTGAHEAIELRDHDPLRFQGKGVLQAVANVNQIIAPRLLGHAVAAASDITEIDQIMLELDGTDNKSHLGANATLAVSMASVRAAALVQQQPLYQYIATLFGRDTKQFTLPIPMMNVLNGGKHAAGASDMQEYMIMPVGAPNIAEAVRYGTEVFHHLGKLLTKEGFATTVGDEGGYAPALGNNEMPLQLITEAITKAGYVPRQDIAIALDPAASELYDATTQKYNLATENQHLTSEQMTSLYGQWLQRYPIVSIEDGLSEDDWAGFTAQTAALGQKMQIVGDDLFVTNPRYLQRGIDEHAANAILIKLNQIGTVSETIDTIKLAQNHGYAAVVSHRSGETEDTFIADFVVGAGTGQIKTGSLCRSERVAKYNRLMMIERELGGQAHYAALPARS
jgi:enolase